MKKNRKDIMALRSQVADNRKEFWSEKDRESLKHMYSNGYGISEMALKFGRSEDAIVNQIHTLELQPRVRVPYAKKSGCKCPKCKECDTCRKGRCGPFEDGQ